MSLETPATNSLVMEMRGVAVASPRNPDDVTFEAVNWTVAPGDFWVIGGLRGAGKNDLLMLTGGMTAPAAGDFFLFGNPMPIFEGELLSQRLRAGYVFEGGQMLSHLTVAENVALPLQYHKNLGPADAEGPVLETLEATGLMEWADSTPGAMTLQWRRRAGLARALVLKPEVLLLDNPLAGLDTRQRAWWLSFLGDLARGHAWLDGKPLTIVATADDFRPWRNVAKQFAVLQNKRFVVIGSWEQLEAASDEMVRELAAKQSE